MRWPRLFRRAGAKPEAPAVVTPVFNAPPTMIERVQREREKVAEERRQLEAALVERAEDERMREAERRERMSDEIARAIARTGCWWGPGDRMPPSTAPHQPRWPRRIPW